MIPNRRPGSLWCLRRDFKLPWVYTEVNDQIVVAFDGSRQARGELALSRKDARLLAKRINECLDATVKR